MMKKQFCFVYISLLWVIVTNLIFFLPKKYHRQILWSLEVRSRICPMNNFIIPSAHLAHPASPSFPLLTQPLLAFLCSPNLSLLSSAHPTSPCFPLLTQPLLAFLCSPNLSLLSSAHPTSHCFLLLTQPLFAFLCSPNLSLLSSAHPTSPCFPLLTQPLLAFLCLPNLSLLSSAHPTSPCFSTQPLLELIIYSWNIFLLSICSENMFDG